jgi:hypothetical protein
MRIEPELGGSSIVLLGSFNPAIFTPHWFARWDIVSAKEADNAEVFLIHPEIANFRLGSKLVQVEPSRFLVETSEGPWIVIADFVVTTLKEHLPHTPVHRLGINRTVHFSVGDEATRNAIGRMLAPTKPWGEWGTEIENAPKELRGGFRSLVMQQTRKEGDVAGHVQAHIQPSARITAGAGIFITVNDEYVLTEPLPVDGCARSMGLLEEHFDRSIRRAEWIIDQVMALREEVGR